ncbi:glucocorticoid modulatory element-binding protein 1-like isoform X1 [Stegostoma tigrinum]|uniref:glucocorticoid modulatory element-binding protein 1-like isoform X1 n=2 Tax=Stegostoma tigrinum TaxID=3053191 RepID=UPI00202B1B19|nr:glucocorticoid modulatory element-binding protein 1-like isoform X1 [Stegostoma tigrinum]
MANAAEVNAVPVGDVVVVKAEPASLEGESSEESKTQVILQLQPVQHGMCEEGAESNCNASVVTVETHTLQKLADGEDICNEINEEVEIAYPITCGESKAILLWKKFVCPGINVKCVKFNDQLISPKQFVHLAGKSTLKDWKRAIRIGGIMLRKMMDSGQLDFYQHDKVCTNTCRSTKFDLLISSARAPVPSQQSNVIQTPTSIDGNGTHITVSEENTEECIEWSPALTTVAVTTEDLNRKDGEEISEDTLAFWKGIADVGLLGEVVTNIQKELMEMLAGVQQRMCQTPLQITDAAVLNNMAHTFGLLETVKKVLDKRKSQTDQSQEQIHSDLAELERQLEEQRRRAKEQKLKNQTLQNVVLMPIATPKPNKRPRLQRPASATILTPTTPVQTPQFTVISPIAITPIGTNFSVANVTTMPVAIGQQSSPVTVHTLSGGTQLFTRYAGVVTAAKTTASDTVTIHPTSSLALLSTAAIQDSNTITTVAGMNMGPVELVTVDSGLVSVVQSHSVDHSTSESQTVIEIHPGPEMDSDPDGTAEAECDDKVPDTDNETQIQAIEVVTQEEQQNEQNEKN